MLKSYFNEGIKITLNSVIYGYFHYIKLINLIKILGGMYEKV